VTRPSTERREFFRVKDRLFIEFRLVDEEESLVLEKTLRESNPVPEPLRGQAEFASPDAAFGRDEIFAYLEMLDRKLNMVIDLLSRKEHVYQGSYMDVTLSGSGIKYVSETRLDEGAFMEIRLVLPFFPGTRITALGKVVRSRRLSAGDKDAWETAVSFAAINEKDRDILVRYVFSKERKTLRTRHEPQADEP
jgi:hypothetical protein